MSSNETSDGGVQTKPAMEGLSANTQAASDPTSSESASVEPQQPATSAAEQSDAATNGATDSTSAAPALPRRTLRLNPTLQKDDAKAIPSLKSRGAENKPRAPQNAPSPAPTTEPSAAPAHLAAQLIAPSPAPDEAAAKPAPATRPAAPAPPRPTPVALPPKDQELDAELEAEINAALAETGDLQEVVITDESEVEAEGEEQQPGLASGTKLKGTVQSVGADELFVELGFRSPGVVQVRQFEAGKVPQVGQQIDVIVDRVEGEDGLIILNVPRGRRKVGGDWSAVAQGQIVDCMVTKTNKGGLEVNVGTLRGFLPAGQVDLSYVSDLEPYVGQKLTVQVMEVNPRKRNLVVSRRACLEVERKEAAEQLWKTLQVGQTRAGKVKTMKDYGAFIDIGGADGFLHIGEISWQRIRHPSDALREGQEVEVTITSLDPEKKKISLGMRQLTQNPWLAAAEKYAAGSAVSGTVTRTTEFGAFVQLEAGIEGLVHISELDHKRVKRVTDVLKVGQHVDAQVLEADPIRRRISLSLKALKPAPEAPKDEDFAPSQGQKYERKRSDLKGGTGTATTTGGLFGDPRNYSR
jgi:small subunit ribosomal protein S1